MARIDAFKIKESKLQADYMTLKASIAFAPLSERPAIYLKLQRAQQKVDIHHAKQLEARLDSLLKRSEDATRTSSPNNNKEHRNRKALCICELQQGDLPNTLALHISPRLQGHTHNHSQSFLLNISLNVTPII